MKTDDRDMDSSNPSKSFKVGDFDHLSGFFTPVWESNRRVRSESTPSVEVTASAGAPPHSTAPDSDERAAPVAGQVTTGNSEAAPRKAATRKANKAAGKAAPSRAAGRAAAPKSKSAARGASPPKAPSAETAQPAAGVTSPAAVALRQAGPNLPKEDFIDSEPEFRAPAAERPAPPRAATALTHQRSLRASAAATVVHERLKAKLSEVATPPDVDSAPDSARGGALPISWGDATPGGVTSGGDDLYPPHVLRQLRRTLRLSTPLPQSVRALVAQYNRN